MYGWKEGWWCTDIRCRGCVVDQVCSTNFSSVCSWKIRAGEGTTGWGVRGLDEGVILVSGSVSGGLEREDGGDMISAEDGSEASSVARVQNG